MSYRKVQNMVQLYTSYHWSRIQKRAIHSGLPMTISIEPTTACNLRCPECPSGLRNFTRPTGNLKRDFFRSLLDQVQDHLVYLIFYFQGEPFINPDFLNMVEYAHQKNIYTITSSNGHFINSEAARQTVESGLDRLILSIDGTTQEVYEQYRVSGALHKVIEAAQHIVCWKQKLNRSHPYLIFQFLVVRPNEHQIPEVFKLANEIGVDQVHLKTAQVYDYQYGNPLIPTIEKYARYQKMADGTYRVKNKLLSQCWKQWHSCVVTWDGRVVPCCFDKDATHQLGDLKKTSFANIWNSAEYNTFRNKILGGRASIDICQNCTEGCKVEIRGTV